MIISENLIIQNVEYNSDDFVQAERKNKYTKHMVAWAASSTTEETEVRFALDPFKILDEDLSTDYEQTMLLGKKRKVISKIDIKRLEIIDVTHLSSDASYVLREMKLMRSQAKF